MRFRRRVVTIITAATAATLLVLTGCGSSGAQPASLCEEGQTAVTTGTGEIVREDGLKLSLTKKYENGGQTEYDGVLSATVTAKIPQGVAVHQVVATMSSGRHVDVLAPTPGTRAIKLDVDTYTDSVTLCVTGEGSVNNPTSQTN